MDRLDGLLSKLRRIDLSGEITDVRPVLKGFGASCDVFVGLCRSTSQKVAVKRLRVFMSREEEFAKRLFKELYIWSKLDHPNVLPLLGYFIEDGELPNLVSEWMERGTLHDNMTNIVKSPEKLAMVMGIASGLHHLHLHEVVHADLKSHNVLLSSSGEPLLTDFGVSHILACSLSTAGGTTSNLSSPKGTVRWMAKELFQSNDSIDPQPHNKTSDVWAFGMVIYELLSHKTPYCNLRTDMQVMFAISTGVLPSRPSKSSEEAVFGLDDELWKLCNSCWNAEPSARPTVENILIFLNELLLQQTEAEELAALSNKPFPTFQPLPQFAVSSDIHEGGTSGRVDRFPDQRNRAIRQACPRHLPPALPVPSIHIPLVPIPSFVGEACANDWDKRARSSPQVDRPPLAINTDLPQTWQSRTTPTQLRPRTAERSTPSKPTPNNDLGMSFDQLNAPNTPPLRLKKKKSGNSAASTPHEISRTASPRIQHHYTQRTSQRKELIDFRPSEHGIYEALDDFFPDCDLDKPAASASTPSGSPTAVGTDLFDFKPISTTRIDKKVRRSIRVVAAEQQQRLSDPNLQSFERRSVRDKLIVYDKPSSPRPATVDRGRPYNWVRGQAIGRGTNSNIFLAMDGQTGELLALKRAELPQTNHDDSRQAFVIDAMRRECGILRTLSHRNVVQFIGQVETSGFFHIFMEYVPGGTIAGYLKKYGKFEDQAIRSFTGQILSGLEHIHDRGIIHCELKSDNILIAPFGACKLCDFGLARRVAASESASGASVSSPSVIASPSWQMAIWVAPEIMRAAKNGEQYVYDFKVDIWALGCVVLEMVAGKQPWGDAVIFELIDDRHMLPPAPADIELSSEMEDFRRKCLSNCPTRRRTATDLLRHPYLILHYGWMFGGFP